MNTVTAARPDPVLLLPADADRGEWLAARRGGIGASEIAAVLGISPWESPFGLYWRKVNGWESEETDETSAGHRAEPVIADWFADQHPEFVVHPAGLYAHPQRPWQRATPDRLVYRDCAHWRDDPRLSYPCFQCFKRLAGPPEALLECKYLIGGWDGWGEPGTDDIPVHYRAQALWQLDVLGVDEVHVAAWHGAQFRQYLVRRDETDLRMMREAGRRFMARIERQDPPDVDGHGATITALKRLHPTVDDIDIQVPVEFAEGYRRARDLARRAAALVDRYDARARQLLGTGRRLLVGKKLVVSRSVYDQSGDTAELLALDGEGALVDRLNPGRASSYVH